MYWLEANTDKYTSDDSTLGRVDGSKNNERAHIYPDVVINVLSYRKHIINLLLYNTVVINSTSYMNSTLYFLETKYNLIQMISVEALRLTN